MSTPKFITEIIDNFNSLGWGELLDISVNDSYGRLLFRVIDQDKWHKAELDLLNQLGKTGNSIDNILRGEDRDISLCKEYFVLTDPVRTVWGWAIIWNDTSDVALPFLHRWFRGQAKIIARVATRPPPVITRPPEKQKVVTNIKPTPKREPPLHPHRKPRVTVTRSK